MAMTHNRKYSSEAIERARDGALEWLEDNTDGYPRSWGIEQTEDARRGYARYGFEAPPIAGYEALEQEGKALRLERVLRRGEERVHFRLVRDLPKTAPD